VPSLHFVLLCSFVDFGALQIWTPDAKGFHLTFSKALALALGGILNDVQSFLNGVQIGMTTCGRGSLKESGNKFFASNGLMKGLRFKARTVAVYVIYSWSRATGMSRRGIT
jgi:hypothetical protein